MIYLQVKLFVGKTFINIKINFIIMNDKLFSYLDKVKKYARFTSQETKAIIFSILIITIIVGFSDGRADQIADSYFFFNLLIMFIFVAIAILAKIIGQKLIGIENGFRTEYSIWWYGLLIGVIVSFITKGKIWILIPGSIICNMMPGHRLGKFRYGMNYFPLGWTGAFGPISNLILAFIFKVLTYLPFGTVFFEKAVLLNVLLAVMNILPIPPLDGSMTFFGSRVLYVFTSTSILAFGLSLIFFNILIAILILILAVIIVTPLYIYFFEYGKGWWT